MEAVAFISTLFQLEPYMDEAFLLQALHIMGEQNIVSIKVMRNKFTGEPANYGFINFDNDYSALLAMHKLNSKIIPNTNPVRATSFYKNYLIITVFRSEELDVFLKLINELSYADAI